MRKSSLVFHVYVCAFAVTLGMGLSSAPSRAAADPSGNDSGGTVPTVGGQAAFATKSDAMASTVEGFLEVKDYAGALKAAQELTGRDPRYLKGWMLLGYCYTLTQDFTKSNDAYDQALELGAESESVLTRKAYNYLRLSRFDEARKCYNTLLETKGDDAETLRQLGYIESKLGNYDQAANYYRRVLEVEPNSAETLDALAKIEAKRGGNGEAKELLLKTLELDPDNTDALGRLGIIHIKDGRYAEAVAPLEKLVSLEPENVKARRNLGVAYYQLDKKDEACDEFRAVRSLGGDMEDLYGPLADCYFSSGETQEALAVIKEGIEKDLQKAWLYCIWGNILEKSHRYDDAIGKFAAAASTREEPWSTYAHKQIARQEKLKKRAEMISSQGM